MTLNRRMAITSGASAMALALSQGAYAAKRAAQRQKILILGGSNFVGPAMVEQALAKGHEVTLFNRGVTRPYLFPKVEKLRGDRNPQSEDLSALAGRRRWDAVIDVWPEHQDKVERTARLLADRVEYYYFVSSIAAYSNFDRPGMDEEAPLRVDEEDNYYGGEKARTEEFLQAFLPGRAGSGRCQAILGPLDDGWAYHYWLKRLSDYDEVLAPGSGDDFVQYVDVRDVAAWTIDCVERRRAGPYNITGPQPPMTMRSFLEETNKALGGRARLVWADADFLRRDQDIRSFDHMPLWAPLDEDEGFYQISSAKGLKEGMNFRPLAETARDAYRWSQSHFFKNVTFPHSGYGISREKEELALAAWKAR